MTKNLFLIRTLLLCVLSITGVVGKLNAQTAPAIEWQTSLGGSGEDRPSAIQQTTDGGYIVVGYTNSDNGDVTGNSDGHPGAWIVKLNGTGNISWQKFRDSFYVSSVQQTTDGGYIVAGDTGAVTPMGSGMVIKLDNSGNIQWEKSIGGTTGVDVPQAIQQTVDGGYIVGGYTTSYDGDATGKHGGSDTRSDYWVVKLNSAGEVQWHKCYGGSGDEYAYSIQQTVDGGYVIAGRTDTNNDGDVSGMHGVADYWVIKIDGTGNIQWLKCLGGSAGEEAYSIQQTSDGGYMVAGYTASTDGDVTNNHGITNYWVVKLDNTGNIQWQKCYGGSVYDYAFGVQQTNDGGYVIVGQGNSNDGDETGKPSYNSDCWVVKINALGNIMWQKSLGGTEADYAYVGNTIQQTTDGGFIIAATSDSDDGDITGHHGYSLNNDFWIVKLAGDGALPLNYINFSGKLIDNNVQLSWQTAQEQNTNYFTVEKSADAVGAFQIVAKEIVNLGN